MIDISHRGTRANSPGIFLGDISIDTQTHAGKLERIDFNSISIVLMNIRMLKQVYKKKMDFQCEL